MDNLAERLANLSPEKRAMILSQLATHEQSAPVSQAEQGLVTGPVPLLPMQQKLLSMMAAYRLNYHHYNMCTMLEVAQPLDPTLMKQVVQNLILHHDALRLRVQYTQGDWQQSIGNPDEETPFSTQDFSMIPEQEQKSAIEAAAAQLQTSLNVSAGPILRIAYFYLGSQQPGRLLFIIHHIASDAYSLRIVLEDFFTAYQQLSKGLPIKLPEKTTSVQQRAERLLAYVRSPEIRKDQEYWLSRPWTEVVPFPLDFPEGVTARPQSREIQFTWGIEETKALIRTASRSGGAQTRDVVLAALASTFASWNGSRTQLFAMHNHGRRLFDDLDLLRTVGWLTVHPNVVVCLPENDDPETLVSAVSEQMKSIPNEGAGFELLRHASDNPEIVEKFNALPTPNVVFNYLGQQRTSPLFRAAQEFVGPQICLPNLWKSDQQMIFAEIIDSQLHLHWEYSETVYRRSTIENLANQCLDTLRTLTKDTQ